MAPILLSTRQSSTTTTSSNCPSTISAGGIAGIVIGSIAGTLLLLWLYRLCRLPGAPGNNPDVVYSSSSVTPERRRRRRSYHGGSSSYDGYVEKTSPSGRSRSGRRVYRDDVRRPERVYVTSA